jgi:hypothetical protein
LRRLALVLLLFLVPASALAKPAATSSHGLVNFRYIQQQRAEIRVKDKGTQLIWRVDAAALARRDAWHDVGPPPPAFRGRSDLISIDDIAWVVLCYLKQAQLDKAEARHALDEAKKGLRTLLALQRADGSFVAYQAPESPTETVALFNSGDWLATARAIQAMGAGVWAFHAHDRGFAESLEKALALSLQRVQATWGRPEHNVGRHYVIDQMRLPAWLPYNRVDAAAAIVLGLSDWYAVKHDEAPLPVLRALADAIVDSQKGSPTQYPWDAFLPEADKPALWYPDGGLQAAALIRAREVLKKPTYLSTALLESNLLYPHILAAYDILWQMSPRPDAMPGVPGGAACMAINAAALYRATGKDRHSLVAALYASWLTTPHGRGPAMYDPATGRCADVYTADGPSRTSSPGASARAIFAFQCLSETPGIHLVQAVAQEHDAAPLVLSAVDGRPVSEPISVQQSDLPGGTRRLARISHDNTFWLKFDVNRPADYQIDMVYVKDSTSGAVVNVRLDGDAILAVPLGVVSDGDPLAARQQAIGPTRLDPGLHTLGVRGNGLLMSSGSLLDSFVVQPVVAWRFWRMPDGHRLAVFANLGGQAETAELPASLRLPSRVRHTSLWSSSDGTGRSGIEATRASDGGWVVRVPACGSGSVEW